MTQNFNRDVEQELIGIITGEIPLSRIADLGVEISSSSVGMTLRSNLTSPVVYPAISDIIRGFMTYKDDPDKLRLWAFFCLGECGAIDFSKIEEHPFGEETLEELWEASYSGRVSEDFLKKAQAFVDCQTETHESRTE